MQCYKLSQLNIKSKRNSPQPHWSRQSSLPAWAVPPHFYMLALSQYMALGLPRSPWQSASHWAPPAVGPVALPTPPVCAPPHRWIGRLCHWGTGSCQFDGFPGLWLLGKVNFGNVKKYNIYHWLLYLFLSKANITMLQDVVSFNIYSMYIFGQFLLQRRWSVNYGHKCAMVLTTLYHPHSVSLNIIN